MPRKATPKKPSADDLAQAASLLRQVVELAKAGVLEAKSPEARAILRRIEGAVIAAELAAGKQAE